MFTLVFCVIVIFIFISSYITWKLLKCSNRCCEPNTTDFPLTSFASCTAFIEISNFYNVLSMKSGSPISLLLACYIIYIHSVYYQISMNQIRETYSGSI